MSGLTSEVHGSDLVKDLVAAEDRAYKESTHLSVPKVAGYVLDVAGQKISAVSLGLRDARPVRAWQNDGEIREENESRLRLLYRILKTVASIYDESTARAFLRSSSPYLDDVSPMDAIAAHEETAALEAMRSFLAG